MTLANRFPRAGALLALFALLLSLALAPSRAGWPTSVAASAAASFDETSFLGFYGNTCPNYPDYAICRNGGIANTGFTEILSGTNSVDLSKITLSPAGSGTLTIRSTAGDLRTPGTPQDNALVSPFDGAATPFTVGARLLGPFTGLNQSGQSGGIVVGINANNYARLTVGQDASGPAVLFDRENNGAFAGTRQPLNLATVTTIDLFLTVDPVAETISALYRVNSNDPNNVTLMTTVVWPDQLVVDPVYGGLVTTNGSAPAPVTFTYDWFKVGAPVSGISFEGPLKIIDRTTPGSADFANPTTMTFGPDGRLYVGTQSGRIYAYTLDANANPTAVQVIEEIYDKPNWSCPTNVPDPPPPTQPCPRDTSVKGRQLLGMVFHPQSTPISMTLYVSHSDPRIFRGDGSNLEDAKKIDTYSGTISRLQFGGAGAAVTETTLVLGLPRSRNNHATNGMVFGADGWLYIAQGGNTNIGAPSTFFSNLPEYYLSAAVLRMNVAELDGADGPLDVREIDSAGDLEPLEDIFELYATGLRNPYDLVWHSNGKLYSNVNASNHGLGETPGEDDGCPDGQRRDLSPSPPDALEWVRPDGYFGHPVPIRDECVWENGFYPATPDPYDLDPDPDYQTEIYTYTTSASVDGITEYTSDTFDGALQGNLVVAAYAGDQAVRRLALSDDGQGILNDTILTRQLPAPIDVIADDDGRVYIANIFGPGNNNPGGIYILNPIPQPPACPAPGSDPAVTDNDGDGFIDQDEIDNGTDSCSPSSTPADFDNDKLSDRYDHNSDGDGAVNNRDQLQFDAANGAATSLPYKLDFFEETRGIQKSGFNGVLLRAGATEMTVGNNGHGFGLYEPEKRIRPNGVSGALGLLATPGSSQGAANNQDNALQVGFNTTGSFTITTEIADPFVDRTEALTTTEESGIFFGLDADNYVKLVLRRSSTNRMSVLMVSESQANAQEGFGQKILPSVALPFTGTVRLALVGNPRPGYLLARYRIESAAPDQPASPWIDIGLLTKTTFPAMKGFFGAPSCGNAATASGCIATAGVLATGPEIPFGFNYFEILPYPNAPTQIFQLRLPIVAKS